MGEVAVDQLGKEDVVLQVHHRLSDDDLAVHGNDLRAYECCREPAERVSRERSNRDPHKRWRGHNRGSSEEEKPAVHAAAIRLRSQAQVFS